MDITFPCVLISNSRQNLNLDLLSKCFHLKIYFRNSTARDTFKTLCDVLDYIYVLINTSLLINYALKFHDV